jgi:hypothetical protein
VWSRALRRPLFFSDQPFDRLRLALMAFWRSGKSDAEVFPDDTLPWLCVGGSADTLPWAARYLDQAQVRSLGYTTDVPYKLGHFRV